MKGVTFRHMTAGISCQTSQQGFAAPAFLIMNYNIETVKPKQFRELLSATVKLDLNKIKSNLQIVNGQLSGADLGYAKCGYNRSGILRLLFMREIYIMAIMLKTDCSGPTKLKASILYAME